MNLKKYNESYGKFCPVCVADECSLSWGTVEFEEGLIYQEARCNSCGAIWIDRYHFTPARNPADLHGEYETGEKFEEVIADDREGYREEMEEEP